LENNPYDKMQKFTNLAMARAEKLGLDIRTNNFLASALIEGFLSNSVLIVHPFLYDPTILGISDNYHNANLDFDSTQHKNIWFQFVTDFSDKNTLTKYTSEFREMMKKICKERSISWQESLFVIGSRNEKSEEEFTMNLCT